MSDFPQVPDFKDLPPVEGMPEGCAWGVFDKDGKKDIFGCLNFLTPSIAAAAASEVQSGISVSLNAPIDAVRLGFRRDLEHKPINWKQDKGAEMIAWDDEVAFNTQVSSQWDSLLHFAHQETGKFYNGADPNKEELSQLSDKYDTERQTPSLDKWHRRGGLVGRGVLLDYVAFAKSKGLDYSPFRRHAITTDELEAMAEFQGTEMRKGDILILRTGFLEELTVLDAGGQMAAMGTGSLAGVQGTKASAEWFWNHRLAAVASDNIAFEVMPPEKADGTLGTHNELVLHQYFLSLFGLSIGELFSLKELAEQCAKLKRYSFFLTSIPLNVPGLIGSPPNALAIF